MLTVVESIEPVYAILNFFGFVCAENNSAKSSKTPGTAVIKLCPCLTQLLTFIMLIEVKMPMIVGMLTFISRIKDWLS